MNFSMPDSTTRFEQFVDREIHNHPEKSVYTFSTNNNYQGISPTKEMLIKMSLKYAGTFETKVLFSSTPTTPHENFSFKGKTANEIFAADSKKHTTLTLTKIDRISQPIKIQINHPSNNNNNLHHFTPASTPAFLPTIQPLAFSDTYPAIKNALLKYLESNPNQNHFSFRSDTKYNGLQPNKEDLQRFAQEFKHSFNIKLSDEMGGQTVGHTTTNKTGNHTSFTGLFYGCEVTNITYQDKKVDLITVLKINRL